MRKVRRWVEATVAAAAVMLGGLVGHEPLLAQQSAPESESRDSSDRRDNPASFLDALGLRRGGRPLPDGLIIGGDCPPAGRDADAEIAAQASARIALKVGLTLTNASTRVSAKLSYSGTGRAAHDET